MITKVQSKISVAITKAMTQKKHWGGPGYYLASMQKNKMKEPLAPAMHKVNNAAPHCHCAQQSMPSQNTQANETCSAGLYAEHATALGRHITANCKARKGCCWRSFAVLGISTDLALVVLPVPGGPSNSTARGLLFAKWRRVPLAMVSYTSGCSRASSIVSSICCF